MKKTSIQRLNRVLCVLLVIGMLPLSALAAEEAPEAFAEGSYELIPYEEFAAEPETGDVEISEAEILAEDEAAVSEDEADAEEIAEAPVEESEDGLGGVLLHEYADPEDPLYERYRQEALLNLDGAGTKTWSDFTTRTVAGNETLHKGIDVSSWQENINWTKVKAAGVEFAILRCAYRGVSTGKLVKDGYFTSYIKGAKAAGIQVGVYIFSQAVTVEEALEEADFMLNLVKDYDIDLPLVFDLEHYPGGRFSNAKLSKRAVTDMCNAFCERVEAAGYESMVYFNPSNLTNDVYPDEIGRLWLAHYTTKTSYTARNYEYWQCSSDGAVNGISGAVDLDFWFEPDNENPFTDVKKTDWYYDTVIQAYQEGIVSGVSATSFAPQSTATRAQVVTMLHRTQDSPEASASAGFTDLTQDWYRPAVNWAAETGIVNGVSAEEFAPDRAITREELVTILYRMKGEPEVTYDLSSFSDREKIHTWAENAMAWAVENKIITGYEDGTLRPRNNASRAEVCAIILRYSALK
ncbi:MAG: S-layer homology domain-containing protein [Oscillospiraceae bacterium]